MQDPVIRSGTPIDGTGSPGVLVAVAIECGNHTGRLAGELIHG